MQNGRPVFGWPISVGFPDTPGKEKKGKTWEGPNFNPILTNTKLPKNGEL